MTLNYESVEQFQRNRTAFEAAILATVNQTGVTIENLVATAGSVVVTFDIVFLTSSGRITDDGEDVPFATFIARRAAAIDEAVAVATDAKVLAGFVISAATSQYLPPSPPPAPPPDRAATSGGASNDDSDNETDERGIVERAARELHPGIVALVIAAVITVTILIGAGAIRICILVHRRRRKRNVMHGVAKRPRTVVFDLGDSRKYDDDERHARDTWIA